MSYKNNSKKIISAILIVSIILPTVLLSRPPKAEAYFAIVHDPIHTATNFFNGTILSVLFGTSAINTGLHIKDIAVEVLKEIARTFAKRLLQQMTLATVNWINTGFHGSPLFVQNPSLFFRDIQKYEIRTLVNLTGLDPNRNPFGRAWALNTINSYKNTLANNAAYSYSNVIRDPVLLNKYRTDFNTGGWNAFLVNSQYPQNNYLGYTMMMDNELAARLQGTEQTAAKQVNTTLSQGMGFLSPKMCPTNPNYNNGKNEFQRPEFTPTESFTPPDIDAVCRPLLYGGSLDLGLPEFMKESCQSQVASYNSAIDTYNANVKKEEAGWAASNSCPGGLASTTPGSVVGNQISKALGSSTDKTTLAAAVGGSISAILDSLLNKFFDSVTGGLTGSGTRNFANETNTNDNTPGTCSTGGTNSIPLPSLKTKDECVSLGGVWSSSTTSTVDPTIANCTLAGGGNTKTTKAECDAVGGTWGTTLPSAIFGTCEVSGETSKTTRESCETVGGVWSLTPPVGDCTVTDATTGLTSTSSNVSEDDCATNGGTWERTTPLRTPPTPVGVEGLRDSDTVSTNVGDTTRLNISGGTGPYTANSTDSIARVSVSENTLVIRSIAAGATTVTITDSSRPTAQEFKINLTISN